MATIMFPCEVIANAIAKDKHLMEERIVFHVKGTIQLYLFTGFFFNENS